MVYRAYATTLSPRATMMLAIWDVVGQLNHNLRLVLSIPDEVSSGKVGIGRIYLDIMRRICFCTAGICY
jgi:hypothetical protein